MGNTLRFFPILILIGMPVTNAAVPQPVGHWDFTSPAEVISDKSGANDLRIEGCQWGPSKLGSALNIASDSGRDLVRQAECSIAARAGAWPDRLGPSARYGAVLCGRQSRQGLGRRGHGRAIGCWSIRTASACCSERAGWSTSRAARSSGASGTRSPQRYDGKEAVAFLNGQVVARALVEGPIAYDGRRGHLSGGLRRRRQPGWRHRVFEGLRHGPLAGPGGRRLAGRPRHLPYAGGDHGRALCEAGEMFPGEACPMHPSRGTATQRSWRTWTTETTAMPTTPAGKAVPADGD